MKWGKPLVILFLLSFSITVIYAQTSENIEIRYNRRLVWVGDEATWRYAVQVDRLENGVYRSFLRQFSTEPFLRVSLPAGEFRYRVIPHDILDRPQMATATPWIHFEIIPPVVPVDEIPDIEEEIIIGIDEQVTESNEQITEGNIEQITEDEEQETEISEFNPFFNTIGFSIGTAFIDPLIIATLHGTYAPMRNLYIEAGFEFGFLSIYDDVESFYCLYPYLNLGYFIPFSEKGGVFAGIGCGLMMANYTFSHIKKDMGFFAMNFFAGVNLWDMLNITYTFKTTFSEVSHKVGVGYVYRVGSRE